MKVIKYNFGGLPAQMAYSEANLAIAAAEADGGEYTVVDEVNAAELTRNLTVDEILRVALEPVLETIPDATASRMVQYFGTLSGSGTLVKAGTRINWNGQLKRAAVDLWDTAENTPDSAPALWKSLDYKNGIRVIPDIITAGTAFAEGEYGWWVGSIYKSTMAGNVYTPAQYADGWELVSEEESN